MVEKNLSQRHHDVIMTSFSALRHTENTENLENRNFALDLLEIITRKWLTPRFFIFFEALSEKMSFIAIAS